MARVFGDITEITCTPDGGTPFRIQCKSKEDHTLDPGGIRVEDDDNSITGAGERFYKAFYMAPSFEFTMVEDNTEDTFKKMVAVLENPASEAEWTVTFLNGVIYKGNGLAVGDLKLNTNAGTVPIKISGSGKWDKI